MTRHSMDATIVDLRYRMKDVLRAIDRGETVTILYHGKRKAKLIPLAMEAGASGDALPRMEDQPIFGMWSDREDIADPVAYVRSLRQARPLPSPLSARTQRKRRKPG